MMNTTTNSHCVDYLDLDANISSKPPKTDKQKKQVSCAQELGVISNKWLESGITSVLGGPGLLRRLVMVRNKGITVEQIFIAIKNYSQSPWHKENRQWKSLFGFMDADIIRKWQFPAIQYPKKDSTGNYGGKSYGGKKFYVEEEDAESLKRTADTMRNLLNTLLKPRTN